MKRASVALSLAASLCVLLAGVKAQQPAPRGNYVADEILVKFSASTNANQRDNMLRARSAARLHRFGRGIDHLKLAQGQSVEAALAAFRAMPGVEAASPNYIRHIIQNTAPPNDPFWLDGTLWNMEKIQAQAVWSNLTVGDGSVIVASIDTGVNYNHPDLSANMWRNPLEIPGNGIDDDGDGYVDDVYGIDTVNHDSNPMDDQGHGTHTAGTIAAVGNNGIGVVGVGWNTKILACKFLDADGSGTDAGALECFNYITALRNRGENIRVSNNSWGQQRGSDPPSAVLQAAIDDAGEAGILNVFGAGNDGTNNDTSPFDPASYSSPSIVSVASSDPSDHRSYFSNFGATSVDIAAPGESIMSTYLGNGYEVLDGTSMATPHVAGVAALLAQMNPTLSVPALKALLLDNVDQLPAWTGRVVSGGRLNAFKAASAVSPPNNNKPTVAITSPTEGYSVKEPATITLEATASDSDGTVQRVVFYANGNPVGAATSSPYVATWTGVPAGSYTLTAVATDDLFGTTTSAPVNISVFANAPPMVTLSAPTEGATFTSPAVITVGAIASDSDGTIDSVAFFANGQAIGTSATAPYSITWAAPMGSYSLTAIAMDNQGATTASAPVHITVNPIPGRTNIALATTGATALASSTYTANYPPAGAINGDRKGAGWGAGGAWCDGTSNTWPDWLEVDFSGLKLIEEVDLFSMQDTYSSPVEPTPTMTANNFAVRSFQVQYWTGSSWAPVPGGAVTNNNLVWRQVTFVPLTTSKIRVNISNALANYSRVMELEAWGIAAAGNVPPDVSITTPAEGAALTTPGDITINATAGDSGGTVTSVDFFANGQPIGTDTTSPYSVTWSNVAAGSYTLTAVATDNDGATTTSSEVHVTVAANVPPSISITSPAEAAAFNAPATIAVTTSASDSDGTVASVAFYANGTLIGTDSSAPFTTTWANVTAGTYTLTAIATDNNGASTTSNAVHVSVTAIPGRSNVALAANGGVAIASSTYNANYPASGAINGDRRGVGWGAGGGWCDGTSNSWPDWYEVDFAGMKSIDEVDVFSMQDSYSAPVEPTQTMTFTYYGLKAFEVQYWNGSAWVAVPGGAVTNNNKVWRQVAFSPVTTSKIRVYITSALNTYSRAVEVEAWGVAAAGNIPPTVSITGPTEGTSLAAPATTTITATANDNGGTVTSVAFYANGTLIGTDASSPYSVPWSNVSAGNYTLTAVATDNDGATTTSSAVHVSVVVNAPPTVAITSPGDSASFNAPATITVLANAGDTDGTVQQVAFFANGQPIGTDTTSPYNVTWTSVAAGTYTLTAVATDNQGSTTTSAAVNVTVTTVPGRMNMALATNGGTALASSTYSLSYPASGAINGDRKGLNWGAGGAWCDSTSNTWPDWLEVDFDGLKSIDEVDVFSMQDSYRTPSEPTPSMTFANYGLRTFTVQYWNGSAWVDVPGGAVANNNLVWRQVQFAAVTTSKIRILITSALNLYSRVMEIEAWGVAAQGPAAPAIDKR
ncbi:MAG TPA: Ig-like domain-containing protein [Vicinamibacterales bacterium]|nr:Ig-like domain-containing protein [Vicinamibacterales bacterium]